MKKIFTILCLATIPGCVDWSGALPGGTDGLEEQLFDHSFFIEENVHYGIDPICSDIADEPFGVWITSELAQFVNGDVAFNTSVQRFTDDDDGEDTTKKQHWVDPTNSIGALQGMDVSFSDNSRINIFAGHGQQGHLIYSNNQIDDSCTVSFENEIRLGMPFIAGTSYDGKADFGAYLASCVLFLGADPEAFIASLETNGGNTIDILPGDTQAYFEYSMGQSVQRQIYGFGDSPVVGSSDKLLAFWNSNSNYPDPNLSTGILPNSSNVWLQVMKFGGSSPVVFTFGSPAESWDDLLGISNELNIKFPPSQKLPVWDKWIVNFHVGGDYSEDINNGSCYWTTTFGGGGLDSTN